MAGVAGVTKSPRQLALARAVTIEPWAVFGGSDPLAKPAGAPLMPLSVIRNSVPLPASSELLGRSVDRPSAGPVRGDLTIVGWALADQRPLERVVVIAANRCLGNVRPSQMRPDVMATFPDVPHAMHSGFAIRIPASALEHVSEIVIAVALANGELAPIWRLQLASAKAAPAVILSSSIRTIARWLKQRSDSIRVVVSPPKPVGSREEWQRQAQPGEFAFHEQDRWRRSDDFSVDSARLFRHFGLGAGDYEGRTVLDLGAGSRLRTRYFEGAHLIALEPLAEQFRRLEFSDLDTADELHATPAEELVPQCVNRVDLLVSINVLDHCYDFDAIIRNVRRYLRKNGQAFLSFDSHLQTDALHPLILTPRICRKVFLRHGLQIQHESRGFGPVPSAAGEEHQYYGHPPYALNYLLHLSDLSDP